MGSSLKTQKVLEKVLKKIKPTAAEQEQMRKFTERVLEVAERLAKDFSAKPMLCGSVAKNTWLPPGEVDVFLLFNQSLSKKKLEEQGLQLGKKIISELGGEYKIEYTEHPYLCGSVKWQNTIYAIDIVPCYDVPSHKIKSAVDRTPHHVKFIKANISSLESQALLLKQFCKAHDCYGADLKYQGFSGYLCELLTIKYKSSLSVIKAAAKWHAGVVIKFENATNVDVSSFKNPLVVIDPVDAKRNVAAAVSVECFYKFVKACKDFLASPSEKFFFKELLKPYSAEEIAKEIRRRGTRWYIIKFKRPGVQEDILVSQLRKSLERVESLLKENEFRALRKDFWYNSDFCLLLFELERWMVPRITKSIGPSAYSKHAKEFLRHYKGYKVYTDKDYWVVEFEREFTNALDFLRKFFSQPLRLLRQKGIPSNIAVKDYEVASGAEAIKMIAKMPKEFRAFLREYFEKNLNVAE